MRLLKKKERGKGVKICIKMPVLFSNKTGIVIKNKLSIAPFAVRCFVRRLFYQMIRLRWLVSYCRFLRRHQKMCCFS